MNNSATTTFFKGLFTALPLALTFYAVYWMASGAESVMKLVYEYLLPKAEYYPGMGVALGVVMIFILGVLMNIWVFRRIVEWTEKILEHIPLVKTIYGGMRDMLGLFSNGSKQKGGKVVAVEFAGHRLIGFVMREDCSALPDKLAPAGFVAVYVPLSYQIGGYTFFMPKEKVIPLELGLEDAMRLAVTAGVGASPEEDAKKKEKESVSPSGDS